MKTMAATGRRALNEKQIMSILGVAPLGVYVVAHLWTNLYSLGGAEAFDAATRASRQHPAFLSLEIFGLGVPILVHVWYGLKIVVRARPNNGAYRSLRNLKYLLQRLSGLGVLLFLGAHVVKARIMPATEGRIESWQGMHEALSEMPTMVVYALGMLGISYHLANGIWGSALTLGLTVTPRAQSRMQWLSAAFFVLLLVMSGLAVYGFHPFQ
jgi:succinate dehydrogenase / fumarate reductase cytochrome b subunit